MHLTTPRISLPYPQGLSPDAEASRAHTLHWLEMRGVITEPGALRAYDGLRLERLAARAYPDARGADLDLASDWMAWFFVFDDLFDGPLGRDVAAVDALVEEQLSMLQSARPHRHPSLPLVAVFGELLERSAIGMSEAWRARSAENWSRYIRAYQQEARERSQGVPGDLATFLSLRRDSGGLPSSLDLGERVEGYELPLRLYESEPMAAMRSLCAEVVVITNDIFSASKEAALGQMHNLVLTRMRDSRCEHAAAEAWAVALIAERILAFEQAEQRMRQGVRTRSEWSNIDRFIRGMKNWMRGCSDWSAETSRYPSAEQLRAQQSA
ncbi:avermitilol synthase [Myxococcus fulvus]|uniref:Terpene synthase n=1 Tax=Myxococcus fulvus TaxID=33 RepID=A0A511T5T3_MYXFU|nr:hypothetical protein [Myxococcus fulvus]GEN09536.1 Epi-isozizaene synthase [Myxococcus fulvus]SEU32842.1 avermitilol synthase [Myxococcus fulvus]